MDSEGNRHRCTFVQVERTAEHRRLDFDRQTGERVDRRQEHSRLVVVEDHPSAVASCVEEDTGLRVELECHLVLDHAGRLLGGDAHLLPCVERLPPSSLLSTPCEFL